VSMLIPCLSLLVDSWKCHRKGTNSTNELDRRNRLNLGVIFKWRLAMIGTSIIPDIITRPAIISIPGSSTRPAFPASLFLSPISQIGIIPISIGTRSFGSRDNGVGDPSLNVPSVLNKPYGCRSSMTPLSLPHHFGLRRTSRFGAKALPCLLTKLNRRL